MSVLRVAGMLLLSSIASGLAAAVAGEGAAAVPATMRAAAIEASGGPEVLTLHELPTPKPAADEVVVALDTVKKHVGHVLCKLGAANRTEAVARARELSLIP